MIQNLTRYLQGSRQDLRAKSYLTEILVCEALSCAQSQLLKLNTRFQQQITRGFHRYDDVCKLLLNIFRSS